MSARLPKMESCPFCGGGRLRRTSWGDGFGLVRDKFVGEIRCPCGGAMRAEIRRDTSREGYHDALEIVTDRWNYRAEKKEGGRS